MAQSLLFSHCPSHIPFYHCGPDIAGQAILLERKWATSVGIGVDASRGVAWDHEVVVNGAMHAVWWMEGVTTRVFLNVYLSSRSADERARQLAEATAWIAAFRRRRKAQTQNAVDSVEWVFGGDRNFVNSPEHRHSTSSEGSWHPGVAVLRAWDEFENAMGHGTVMEQPEFTWEKIWTCRDGTVHYCREILDIAGCSIKGFMYINVLPCSSIVDNLPHPTASDHKPVSLSFQPARRLK